MFLINVKTGEKIEAFVERMTASDFKRIRRERNFQFKWHEYKSQDVYKLLINGNDILGMMCIIDRPEAGFDFLEIQAIEVRTDQRGSIKKFDRIAGCLLAFAAMKSFSYGRDGYIALTSKTATAKIYQDKYGFYFLGNVGTLGPRMGSDQRNSQILIDRYL